MFRLVFILQCKSSGEFMTVNGFYTYNLNQAGLFVDKQAAADTGVSSLDTDFVVYEQYKRESDLPAYIGEQLRRASGAIAPPM